MHTAAPNCVSDQFNVATTTSISLPVSPDDSEDVRFEVMWQTDNIGGCSGVSHANSTSVTNGSASYEILRLEEDSCYKIAVITTLDNIVITMAAVTTEAGENKSFPVAMSPVVCYTSNSICSSVFCEYI